MKLKLLFMFTAALFCFNAQAQINNGDFSIFDDNLGADGDTGSSDWRFQANVDAVGTAAIITEFGGNYVFETEVTTVPAAAFKLRLRQLNTLCPATSQKVVLRAKGLTGTEQLKVQFDGDGTDKPNATFNLTTSWADYELALPATSQGETNRFQFQFLTAGTYRIDDVAFSDEAPVLSTADAVFATAKVWLNSATDMLNVNGIEAEAIDVFSVNGKRIATYTQPERTISLKNLSSGLYLVKVQAENASKVYKILK